jgi:hypothetical protein
MNGITIQVPDDRVTMTARLPRDVYDELRAEAKRDERSMNQVLVLALRKRFAAELGQNASDAKRVVIMGKRGLCEWNPERDQPAKGYPIKDGCQNKAVLSVGQDGMWHLCESCAALPHFSRFRRRVPLQAVEE